MVVTLETPRTSAVLCQKMNMRMDANCRKDELDVAGLSGNEYFEHVSKPHEWMMFFGFQHDNGCDTTNIQGYAAIDYVSYL